MTLAVQEFAAQWQLEQEQWLHCAFRNLAPGGAGAPGAPLHRVIFHVAAAKSG